MFSLTPAHGLGVQVLVDDGLADQKDAHFADALDRGQGAAQAVAPPQGIEKRLDLGLEDIEVLVEERGRGKR